MSDTVINLHQPDLGSISQEVSGYELMRALKDLATNNTRNYGIYEDPHMTPQGNVVIFPSPAVPPAGGVFICDGVLTISGVPITVEAFRV